MAKAKKRVSNKTIDIVGAREHNLKNISLSIPKDTLTVITGPSGSGKSSLALDILYTEGKRRYTESLSSYARQFLGTVKKPDVDSIEGLCPSIAIEQKTVGSNPRSTVGTITEIYDYLRVLFARIGIPHCYSCGIQISAQSSEDIARMMIENMSGDVVMIAAPIAREKKGEFTNTLLELFKAGQYRFLIDGKRYKFKSEDDITALTLKKTFKHTIDVLLDQVDVTVDELARLQDAIETSFKLANGVCKVICGKEEYLYSSHRMCVDCAVSIPELEPRLFSFNSPIGACTSCEGIGVVNEWPWEDNDPDSWKSQYPQFFGDKYAKQSVCHDCKGMRLNEHARSIVIGGKNIFHLCDMSIERLVDFFKNVELSKEHFEIAGTMVTEITNRLQFLFDVGLSYLTLNRTARTLSGGEGQRIRLATQIGSALSGVLYVLDEPSIGLHQRDNDRLIETLQSLRDQGNTVVVVEHDTDTMEASDFLIDMGPGSGMLGGQVTATGTPEELKKNTNSLSGAYLSGAKEIAVPKKRRKAQGKITLTNAHKNNLQNVTVDFPLKVITGISGVSGSGKSTLIMQELVPAIKESFATQKRDADIKSLAKNVSGADTIENMVVIDQKPIGRTPRSNPATYLGVFNDIRKLFATLPESNARGYKIGQFSFNVAGGRCAECKGDGKITVEMHFLPEVTVVCKSCKGKRYSKETLQITYKGKNIADVLNMTAYEALQFFQNHTKIAKRIQLMCDVGLEYISLGQPSTTLSGGEAQRIKLVDELAKRGSDTLYILDEPTTGLHSSDIDRLLKVLNRLVDKGNSMIIIEHNLDVLKTVDHLIDLGPEGGDKGGVIVAHGTPEHVAENKESHTGRYLKKIL